VETTELDGLHKMTKRMLLIMRHGKSDWNEPGAMDHDRGLTKRGKRDAFGMGRLMADRGPLPEVILCSSARRARLTANRFAKASQYDGDVVLLSDLYHDGQRGCLDALARLPAAVGVAMLVGHNPALEELVWSLTGDYVRLTTANIACIELDALSWRDVTGHGQGRLCCVLRPKEVP